MAISSLNMAKTESSNPRSACEDRNKDRHRRPGFHVISMRSGWIWKYMSSDLELSSLFSMGCGMHGRLVE